jgi:hypothetical protein
MEVYLYCERSNKSLNLDEIDRCIFRAYFEVDEGGLMLRKQSRNEERFLGSKGD